MKLLLHGCCADCTLKFIESLKAEKAVEITVYYYNPNIHPRSEYQSRVKAMQKVTGEVGVKLILPNWKPSEYFGAIATSSKPGRCVGCWNLRIAETARTAKEKGFDAFSSTLLTSQYQDTEKIQKIGEATARKEGVSFYVPKEVCKDLCTSGFYKQSYCGCCYSLAERMEEKFK